MHTCDKSFTLTHFHLLSDMLLELAGKDHNARTPARPGQLTIRQPNKVMQCLARWAKLHPAGHVTKSEKWESKVGVELLKAFMSPKQQKSISFFLPANKMHLNMLFYHVADCAFARQTLIRYIKCGFIFTRWMWHFPLNQLWVQTLWLRLCQVIRGYHKKDIPYPGIKQ